MTTLSPKSTLFPPITAEVTFSPANNLAPGLSAHLIGSSFLCGLEPVESSL